MFRIERITELQLVAPICSSEKGSWEDLDGLRWNEVQNVPRHINVFSNPLIHTYLQEKNAK